MAPRTDKLMLSLLATSCFVSLSWAQSAAQCVSTPGVDQSLLRVCEQLRTQLTQRLSAGVTVALSSAITYQVDPTSNNGFGGASTLQTSAVPTTGSGAGGSSGIAPTSTGGFGAGSLQTGSRSASEALISVPSSTSGQQSAPTNSQVSSGIAGAGGASNATPNPASPSAGAAGAQDPGITQSSNSDPHHYRNTVIIPVAVVCTVVPILLLALLACCLIRRRRRRREQDTALVAAAANEKYDSWNNGANGNGTSTTAATTAGAVGGPAAVSAAGGTTVRRDWRGRPISDPFTNAAATSTPVMQQQPTPAAATVPSGSHPGHNYSSGAGAGAIAGTGTAAVAGAGATAGLGAAAVAGHHRQPSSNTSFSSAYSQQNNFHGFSGAGSPAHSSPMGSPQARQPSPVTQAGYGSIRSKGPYTQQAPQAPQASPGSNLAPSANVASGPGPSAGILGWRSRSNRSRDEIPATASTTRVERPPTLPEMAPTMGSGTWFAGEYDDPSNHGSARGQGIGLAGPTGALDPRVDRDSDSIGVPREDLSDRYGSGVRSNERTSATPSSPLRSHPTYSGYEQMPMPAENDPFSTPPASARESHDNVTVPPVPPQRSPHRSPAMQAQRSGQPQVRPTSPMDSDSKPARVLGMDEASGSVTPLRGTPSPIPLQKTSREEMRQLGPMERVDPITDRATESTPTRSGATSASAQYMPSSAVGEVIEGPYVGHGYQSPPIGLDNGESSRTPRIRATSYLSEDEARGFDFGSIPRKPVGGR